MVGTRRISRGIIACAVLASAFAFAAPAVLAQGFGDENLYTMQEEYLVEIDDVGDARITDTITYDEAWFEEFGYLFEENPNLLSRRYREDTDVGEVENFDVDIDQDGGTITLTFDAPGYAYNLGDWVVYGYRGYDVVGEDEGRIELAAAFEGVNNEFTLFETMDLEEKVIFDLPAGATNAAFNPSDGSVTYGLAYVAKKAGGDVLADNKTVFLIVFALIMAASLFLFVFAMTRKGAGAPAAAVIPAPEAYAAAPEGPPPHDADVPMFCKKCGHPKGSPDERFCRKCGNPH